MAASNIDPLLPKTKVSFNKLGVLFLICNEEYWVWVFRGGMPAQCCHLRPMLLSSSSSILSIYSCPPENTIAFLAHPTPISPPCTFTIFRAGRKGRGGGKALIQFTYLPFLEDPSTHDFCAHLFGLNMVPWPSLPTRGVRKCSCWTRFTAILSILMFC